MLTKEQKTKLREVYARDVWHDDEKMTAYCVNKTAVLIELPNGDMIPVDKQKIETRFCFGESGYDLDDATRAAAHARNSEDYFKRENMDAFNSMLESIGEQYELHDAEHPGLPNIVMMICERQYIGQPDGSPLKGITFLRWHELLDLLGGSAIVQELPGRKVERYGVPLRVPNMEELNLIRAGHEQARAEHEKKVDRYLKRYGLTKVHAWTYWRDA